MYDHSTEFLETSSYGSNGVGLWYDSDRLLLEGIYLDEITAYRARKKWIEALETNFLLEERHDFTIKVRRAARGEHYSVRCGFASACGRYAFWRLTHHQAPEVQFLLETAHLPHVDFESITTFSCEENERIAVSPSERYAAEQLYSSGAKSRLAQAGVLIRAVARKLFLRKGRDSRIS